MESSQKSMDVMDYGLRKMLVDLLFDLAAGDAVEAGYSYEAQLEHFREILMSEYGSAQAIAEYGQKFKLASKYMYPGHPEHVKKRNVLVKNFASYVLLKEFADSKSFSEVRDAFEVTDRLVEKFPMADKEDASNFAKEVKFLARHYLDSLSPEDYATFQKKVQLVAEPFEQIYEKMVNYVLNNRTASKGPVAALFEYYKITPENQVRFLLEVDALAETTVIKSECFDFIEEFKRSWGSHFPQYRYSKELEDYIKEKKQPYIVAYGNNMSSMRNENYLYTMLADVTVKLALVNGARNLSQLTTGVKDLTKELGSKIKDTFIEMRKNVVHGYGLDSGDDFPEGLGFVLIPFKSDLLYLNDLIVEEISFRDSDNINSDVRQQKSNAAKEQEVLLSQKDAEIYALKRELEYYENARQQEFKSEVSQYNRALTEMVRKITDSKYQSPLNKLYLMANGLQPVNADDVKTTLQNLMFVLGTMDIVPYETGTVGKRVNFYDDEANIVYSVEDSKVKEGINQGVQVYPGWKYKGTELVLPRVEIKED